MDTNVMASSVTRCRNYRRRILEISRQVPAAHIAPAFSCLEIVDALYHDIMRPNDIFIMSKGHGCLAQYVVLDALGRLHADDIANYCKPGGFLGAHPDYSPERDIHASTGSLGHGLGIAAGQALAEQLKGTGARVYVLLSDGECQEGSTWEAAMVASNLGLNNLILLVDSNGWGGMERTDDAFPALDIFSKLESKFRAFGWFAFDPIDGHNWWSITTTLRSSARAEWVPHALICKTVKGKGVSFIEAGQPLWHYRSPSDAEYDQAMKELEDYAE